MCYSVLMIQKWSHIVAAKALIASYFVRESISQSSLTSEVHLTNATWLKRDYTTQNAATKKLQTLSQKLNDKVSTFDLFSSFSHMHKSPHPFLIYCIDHTNSKRVKFEDWNLLFKTRYFLHLELRRFKFVISVLTLKWFSFSSN
jgi:hypothetical protein